MMMLLLVISFGLISISYGTTEGNDHMGHQHTSSDIYDCECTTGYTTDKLDVNCDDNDFKTIINGLQQYMIKNNCDQYCNSMMRTYSGTTKAEFKCFQAYTLVIQYHDYCSSGTVNETLLHEYLDKCPDCLQKHHQYPGAVECDGSLNCTDTYDQEAEIMFVKQNCITSCSNTDCESSWQTVEGYHRMCAHHELTEEFDTIYDELLFTKTECQKNCNVPWEQDYVVNCSLTINEQYKNKLDMYGELDLEQDIGINIGDNAPYNFNLLIITFIPILSFLSVSHI